MLQPRHLPYTLLSSTSPQQEGNTNWRKSKRELAELLVVIEDQGAVHHEAIDSARGIGKNGSTQAIPGAWRRSKTRACRIWTSQSGRDLENWQGTAPTAKITPMMLQPTAGRPVQRGRQGNDQEETTRKQEMTTRK